MYQHHPENFEKGITQGFVLRSVRQLRNMSGSELSKLTEISASIIEDAENDETRLSTEDIEKVAVALKTHPSSIAFPNWDSLPFQPKKITVEGQLLLNNAIEGTKINLHLKREFGLRISALTQRYLEIGTFNGYMPTALGYSPKQKKTIEYKISGDCLGRYYDNYGHGSEFDCDNRVIKSLEISICYYRDSVGYKIDGFASSDDGYVQTNRPAVSPAGDWKFSIDFLIPANLIGQFYGLYPSAEAFLLEEMSKLD